VIRPVYVECAAPTDGAPVVYYRWRCRCCPLIGEWQQWLSDAEIAGEKHRREDHGEGKAVA
jgi:hypothetical protein